MKGAQQSGQKRADSKQRDLETLAQCLWWQLTHHLMSLLGAADLGTCCGALKRSQLKALCCAGLPFGISLIFFWAGDTHSRVGPTLRPLPGDLLSGESCE